MAVGFDNATSAQGNPLTSQSYALPTIAAGETIGLLVAWQPTGAVTISGAGTWTHQGTDSLISGQLQVGLWIAFSATGSESGQNVTINVAAQEKFAAIAFSYAGVNSTTPLLSGPTYAQFTTSNTTSATSPSVSPSPSSWVLTGYASKSSTNASYTTPSGLTLRQSVFGAGGGAIDLSLFDTNAPVSSGGGQTSTMGTATANKIAFTIVLKVAQAAITLAATQGHSGTVGRAGSLAKAVAQASSPIVVRSAGIPRSATPQGHTASLIRSPGIVRSTSQARSQTLARGMAVIRAIVEAHTPVVVRAVSLTEPTATQAHSASLLKAKPLVLSTTISRSSVLIRQPQLVRAGTQGTASTVAKAVALTKTTTQPRTGTVAKVLSRTLAAAQARTASIGRGFPRLLSTTVARVSTLVRQTGLHRTATQGSAATQSNVHVLPDPRFHHGITKVGIPASGASRLALATSGAGVVTIAAAGSFHIPSTGAARFVVTSDGRSFVTVTGKGTTNVDVPTDGAGEVVVS